MKSEEELLHTRIANRYERAIQGTDGVWDWYDTSSDNAWWSPRFYEILGYAPNEIVASVAHYFELIHPDERQKVSDMLDAHMKDDQPFNIEYRLKIKNGDYKWIRAMGKAERDKHGNVQSMAGLIIDIDQEKKAQQRILSLNKALENAFEGIAFIAPDHTLTQVNRAFAECHGYSVDELLGQMWQITTHPDEQDKEKAAYNTMLEQGKSEVIAKGIRKDNTIFYKHLNLVKQVDPQQQFVGYHLFLRDITKEYTTQLRLEHSNQELEQFAYSAAHDLRTPLRGISTLTTWLREDDRSTLSELGQVYLNKIDHRIQRLERYISGLLVMSRIEHDMTQAPEKIDINRLVKHLFTKINNHESFHLHIQRPLPTLLIARDLMTNVFTNLLKNAVEHHHRRTGNITITFDSTIDFYTFHVIDDGPGISEKYAEKVFNLFQTLQTKDERDTVGLGLSIVKKIINTIGGQIWINTQRQQGCEISFSWPKNLVFR